ncbi:DNA-binding XRE family transcriptional regulator [Actinokineospora baliensis]|uniref:helix-turn-helix transcriptional regulator n=1 Tax=Actinokineospora baliensis TaxID=547056 RepID=UPI00195E6057|nr:helix-turn-helix transcriptional regulator [Actinokineospora baliensis]MBM7775995.1 DNA-binding XRE family transcriptional regulator [Actinokineospora baliensis]
MSHGSESEASETAARLAGEVRRLRKAAGLSQPQLAQRVGYTRQYVSLAERPQRNLPSVDLVRALDAALGAELIRLRELAKQDQTQRRARLVGYITPEPERGSSMSRLAGRSSGSVAELCEALTSYATTPAQLQGEDRDPPTLRAVKQDLKAAFDAYQQSRFSVAAGRALVVLGDAQRVVHEASISGRSEAQGVLALSYQVAASVLTKT